ncbi:MAG: gliding motility-associated ABC transporter permease subunit GldF [Paludibacteraceae bacterium]|nr:gliding motility-associated ABC transporter permease subunit GldF [Candidatus Physcocola equi]MCQ2234538.1 gliding motility-associated ABC transporter permease subunit GldF [Paludibacteraceae bacterium]
MLVLLRKELSTFFSSAMGYIVIGVFLLITSLFLWVFKGNYNIIENGYANVDGLFIMAPMLYLFLVPALTMRLIAEEKRTGTLELLLSHPISRLSIVLSKYFAGLILVIISLVPTLIYVTSVYWMGDPVGNMDMGGTWGSYIGLVFLAGVYVAVGVFASSITDNQIIAFIVSAVLSASFYYGFDLLSMLSNSGATQNLISSFGISAHYESMSRGVIDSRDVMYFLAVITLFVVATKTVIEKKE